MDRNKLLDILTPSILTYSEREKENRRGTKKSSDKTPGIDGIEREFLVRYWKLIGITNYCNRNLCGKGKMNSFMERGLIKVIKKDDTDGKDMQNWHTITLLSQIYKLISGA